MIDHLDHLVLTTHDEAACIDFYTRVLGMSLERFVGGTPPVRRQAFRFGSQKINLHVKGSEFEPKAHLPVPGSLDLCFIASVPLEQVMAQLAAHHLACARFLGFVFYCQRAARAGHGATGSAPMAAN